MGTSLLSSIPRGHIGSPWDLSESPMRQVQVSKPLSPAGFVGACVSWENKSQASPFSLRRWEVSGHEGLSQSRLLGRDDLYSWVLCFSEALGHGASGLDGIRVRGVGDEGRPHPSPWGPCPSMLPHQPVSLTTEPIKPCSPCSGRAPSKVPGRGALGQD